MSLFAIGILILIAMTVLFRIAFYFWKWTACLLLAFVTMLIINSAYADPLIVPVGTMSQQSSFALAIPWVFTALILFAISYVIILQRRIEKEQQRIIEELAAQVWSLKHRVPSEFSLRHMETILERIDGESRTVHIRFDSLVPLTEFTGWLRVERQRVLAETGASDEMGRTTARTA